MCMTIFSTASDRFCTNFYMKPTNLSTTKHQ